MNQLREGDMAAVAWSLHGVPQNFTADRSRLLEVIREPVVNMPAGDTRGGECDCGRCSMDTIAQVAEAVQDINWRRKLLLFIGSRIPGRGGTACAAANEPARQRALRAAEAGNLTIHVIDPGGIRTLSSGAASQRMRAAIAGAEARRMGNLLAFTDPTGGRFVHRNQASDVLPEIFRESASYYVLGFEPAYTGTDGKFRRITVRVNRRDILLQARRGYYAPGRPAPRLPELGDDVPVALSGAVAGLWPRTNIQLAVNAAPVAVPGVRGGAVAVVVNVQYDADDARPTSSTTADVAARRRVRSHRAGGRARPPSTQRLAACSRGTDRQATRWPPASSSHRAATRFAPPSTTRRFDEPEAPTRTWTCPTSRARACRSPGC